MAATDRSVPDTSGWLGRRFIWPMKNTKFTSSLAIFQSRDFYLAERNDVHVCARGYVYHVYIYIYIYITRWKIALGRIWEFRSTRNDKHSAVRRSSNVVPVASASGIYDNGISAGRDRAPRGKYAHKGLARALTRSASRWPTFEFIKIHAKCIRCRLSRSPMISPDINEKKKERKVRRAKRTARGDSRGGENRFINITGE